MRKKITNQIDWIGVNDRTTDLFEDFWPLPEGISYNSYLIEDEKNALIDGVKEGFTDELVSEIGFQGGELDLDYVIINHMEPDHSGALQTVSRLGRNVEFFCTEKAKSMLESFYGIADDVRVVHTGDTVELGSHELEFIETPFVHWPETMMTYERGTGILFSGDGFGSFKTLDGGIFDDQVNVDEYFDETVRYFSNIIGAYSATVRAALAKLKGHEIEVVAPAHGLVWRSEPERIIDHYARLSNLESVPAVTLVYGSMYGFTERVMEAVADGVKSVPGVELEVIDAARTHPSFSLSESWKREGLIVGSPTYEARIFTPVEQFINLATKKKLKERKVGF
ncbi:FprA family A-type flavoprotein, partial [Candidatus Bipolaricaulota bacterium]|nr:FprA family A-type flavoprotein [Candidatus Bipolaricaulota bacterium]